VKTSEVIRAWEGRYQSNPFESRTALPFRDGRDRLTVQIQYTAKCFSKWIDRKFSNMESERLYAGPFAGGRILEARKQIAAILVGALDRPLHFSSHRSCLST
jgi:hypothetical protein